MVGMEGELTLPECLNVLKNMSKEKSPEKNYRILQILLD